MLSKFNEFPESLKSLIGLTSLTIIIFFTFLILNIFFGPDKDAELKIAEQKKVEEKANELIATLPRGVLTYYKSDKGQQLSSDEYKMICVNTKIITQRAIMGANIIDNMVIPEDSKKAIFRYDWLFDIDGEKKVISTSGNFPDFDTSTFSFSSLP